MNLRPSLFARALATLAAGAMISAAPLRAQLTATNDWVDGTSDNWSAGANWTNGAPVSGAGLLLRFFTGAGGYAATNDIANPFSLTALLLGNTNTNNAITIAGSQLQFLASGSVGASISNIGAGAVNINNAIDVAAPSLTLGGAGTGVVTLNGLISGTGNVTKSGASTFVLTGNNTYAGGTFLTAGNLRGVLAASGDKPFGTGDLTLTGGTLQLRSDVTNVVVGAGSGYNVVVPSNGNSTINADRLSVASTNNIYRLNNLSVSNGTINATTGNGAQILIQGTTTLGGTNAVFGGANNLSLNGPVTDGGGSTSLRKLGAGTLLLTNGAAISYGGSTLLDAGNLQVFASAAVTNPLPGASVSLRGGTLQIRATNSLTFGSGSGYNFTVVSNGSGINVDRIFNVGANNTIGVNNLTFANASATNITLSGANGYILNIKGTTTLASNTFFNVTVTNAVFDGLITDNGGGFFLRKTGVGRMSITNLAISNTYSGQTFVQQGFLQAWATTNNPAPLGQGGLTLNGGTLEIRTTNSQVFGPGAGGYNPTLTAGSTIDVNRFGSTATGNIIDMGNFTVTGAPTLTVNGGNTYSLRVGNFSIASNITFSVTNAGFIVQGLISETGGSGYTLTKAGLNRMFLTNFVDQGYTGGTIINAGQLQVNIVTNNSQPLGSGANITLNGSANLAALEVRGDTNLTLGPGLGYNIIVTTNGGIIDLARLTTNGGNSSIFVSNVTFNAGVGSLTVNAANGMNLMVNGNISGPGFILDNGLVNNVISNNIINLLGNGANVVFTNPFNFGGSNIFGALRFDAPASFYGENIANITAPVTFNGAVSNATGAPGGLVKLGASSMTFNGPVTLDGNFTGLAGTTTFNTNLNLTGGITNIGGTLVLNGITNNIVGSTVIAGGTVTIQGDPAGGILPLGTNQFISLNNGTLNLRSIAGSMTWGPGLGYNIGIATNSTINVNRGTGSTATGAIMRLGNLDITNSRLTVSGGNTFRLDFNGDVNTLGTTIFDLASANLQINSNFNAAGSTSRIIKTGGSTLTYTGTGNPGHSGGTYHVTAGGGTISWTPGVNPANGATNSFGTGPMVLDGGNAFVVLSMGAGRTNTFTTPFVTWDKAQAAQAQGDGGGALDFNKNGNVVTVLTNTGNLTLGGTLQLRAQGANQGAAIPAIFTGTSTLVGADREITVNRVRDGDARFNFVGNITNDGSARNLILRLNNAGAIQLSGNNQGITDIITKQSYQGPAGKVIFSGSNSLPSGKLYLDKNMTVSFATGFNFANVASIYALTNKIEFAADSILALNTNQPAANQILDLSAAGLNRDVIIGSREGLTASFTNAFTPFSTAYKFIGGGGNITLAGTNQLSGAGNSLMVGAHPYMAPIGAAQGGTLTLNNANSYGGGTVLYPSLPAGVPANAANGVVLSVVNSNTMGTGAVQTYGTLQFVGANGSALNSTGSTNANDIILQPGGALTLGVNNAAPRNRWADNAPIGLMGNTLSLVGRNSNAVDTVETVGTLGYALGNVVNVNNGTAGQTNGSGQQNNVFLIASGLNRTGAATIELTRSGLSTNADISFGAGTRLIFTNAPAVNNGIITPSVINRTDNSFVTYDSTVAGGQAVGVTNAIYTVGTDFSGSTASTVYDLQGAGTNITILAAPVSTYALRVLTNSIRGGQDITIASGGLIAGGNTQDARFIFGSLATPVEGLVYMSGNGTFSNDFVAAGITKFGTGNMTLVNGRSYSNGWNVNWGQLVVSTSNALGTATPGNFVNLNNGQNSVQLTFNQNTNANYNSGPITSYDRNIIAFGLGAGDRTVGFAPLGLTLTKAANGPIESYLRVTLDQPRANVNVLGALNVATDAVIDVADTGVTTGASSRLNAAGGLVGVGRTLSKVGNGILGLTTDNTSTWTGGIINVIGGTLAIGNNGGAGNGTVNIGTDAALQLDANVTNFTPIASINQAPGSVERWLGSYNRWNNNTNSESYAVPAGVALQLQTGTMTATNKTLGLNAGSSVEGYRPALAPGAAAVIPASMSVVLLGNASVGQNPNLFSRGSNNVALTINAPISESGGGRTLTKIGLDTVTLGGNNTYSGGTLVSRGTLNINNGGVNITNGVATNGSATGSGPVTVAAQAMLGGANGRIAGDLTIAGNNGYGVNGGMIMPNTQGGVGAISVGGNLSIGSGGFFDLDLNGTNLNQLDRVLVDGTVDITGALLNVRLGANFPGTLTNSLVFLTVGGTNTASLTGTFTLALGGFSQGVSLTEGTQFTIDPNSSLNPTANGGTFAISYLLGDGNDIGLVVVPEPSQIALMVMGGALLGLQVVRRRRQS